MISESVTPKVSVEDLLNYFWHHLEKDIEILSFTLQRNEVESSLLIHSIMHNMLTVEVNLGKGIQTTNNAKTTKLILTFVMTGKDYSCSNSESREEWERDFSKTYIQPFTDSVCFMPVK